MITQSPNLMNSDGDTNKGRLVCYKNSLELCGKLVCPAELKCIKNTCQTSVSDNNCDIKSVSCSSMMKQTKCVLNDIKCVKVQS